MNLQKKARNYRKLYKRPKAFILSGIISPIVEMYPAQDVDFLIIKAKMLILRNKYQFILQSSNNKR